MKGIVNMAAAVVMALGLTGAAVAKNSPFDGQTYPFITVDQDINDALRSLASHVGVNIHISESVVGRVRGKLPVMSERDYFDFLSKTFGLVDYYDGTVLYVYSADELKNQMVPLKGASPEMVERALRDLDILDDRYPLRATEFGSVIFVAGPERYMQLIQEVVAQLSPQAGGSVSIVNGSSPSWRPGGGTAAVVELDQNQ